VLLNGGVDLFHPPGHLLQLAEESLGALVVVLQDAGGQGDRQTDPLQGAGGLGQFLQKGQGLGREGAGTDRHASGLGGVL